MDKKNQVLYACNPEKWCSIDLKSKIVDTFSTNHIFKFPSMFIVNKSIYFIDHENKKVYIFIKDTTNFKEICSFNTDSVHMISAFSLYIESRKSLISTNYKYCTNDTGIISSISEFSILNNKWTHWEKKIESIFCAAIVATKGEQYLFFIGGLNSNSNTGWFGGCTDRILMYDVRNDDFKQISIKCPVESQFAAAITRDDARDELLTFGFINHCYTSSQFRNVQLLPHYLIRLITNWICHENIHLISTDGDHWFIDIDSFIQSAQ